jgi:hypothetical protein
MKRLVAFGFACLLTVSPALSAKDTTTITLANGSQVGIVNLLGAEVRHFHAARAYQDSFLKTHTVQWSVDDMLNDALKAQLGGKGLTPVPLAATDTLMRSREDCFVNAPLAKGLPKECSPPLAQLASSAGVSVLIVMAPGLNNSDHTSNSRGLSETLRGWGFVTSKTTGARDKPTLFSETELLLIGITPNGATLRARQWGGNYTLKWESFTSPPDLKDFPVDQLDELQPLFAAILSQQAKDLLNQVHVAP